MYRPLLAVRYFLFIIFTATLISGCRLLHPQPEDAEYRDDKARFCLAHEGCVDRTRISYMYQFLETPRLLVWKYC
jgi:hypothetical protein